MTVSLRSWLTLILVLVNAAILGSLALWVSVDEAAQLREWDAELERRVLRQFSNRFEPERAGDIASMLDWPLWGVFEEAMILDQRFLSLEEGQLVPVGAVLNPKGRRQRPQDFPLEAITRGVIRAAQAGEPARVAGGLAIPLFTATGSVWGGVYVRPSVEPPLTPFSTRVLLGFAAVTLLGAGLFYLLLGRAVLAPVEKLAAAAHEFGAGGDPVLPARASTREMDELLRSFEDMMARIRGFRSELEEEVDAATRRAASAERRAARQDRLAAMGTLAAGLAHEINSPLAGALQGVETLRAEARSDRARRYGELTSDALERIGGLVRRLLQLAPARVEAGSCAIQDVVRDLPAFVESRRRGHALEIEVPAAPLRVNGATGDLFPVLLNLVQNALDAVEERYGERGGTVSLKAAAEGEDFVCVTVMDDGPGADPEMLPHLFEPFTTNKEVGKGTGLGLALAYATVRQLGGELDARNRPAGGLEVRLRLPRVREES